MPRLSLPSSLPPGWGGQRTIESFMRPGMMHPHQQQMGFGMPPPSQPGMSHMGMHAHPFSHPAAGVAHAQAQPIGWTPGAQMMQSAHTVEWLMPSQQYMVPQHMLQNAGYSPPQMLQSLGAPPQHVMPQQHVLPQQMLPQQMLHSGASPPQHMLQDRSSQVQSQAPTCQQVQHMLQDTAPPSQAQTPTLYTFTAGQPVNWNDFDDHSTGLSSAYKVLGLIHLHNEKQVVPLQERGIILILQDVSRYTPMLVSQMSEVQVDLHIFLRTGSTGYAKICHLLPKKAARKPKARSGRRW